MTRIVYFWKRNPFIRVLVPFATGIVLQWYGEIPVMFWWLLAGITFVFSFLFFLLSFFQRYRLALSGGVAIAILFVSAGALLTWQEDIRHSKGWFNNLYGKGAAIIASLDEPLTEKARSFKADASVHYIVIDGKTFRVNGKIILYFKKDSSIKMPGYGSRIVFKKPLLEIRNSGNPGGFDYKRFCLFRGITHQVYLAPEEFEILDGEEKTVVKSFLYAITDETLRIIRTNIKAERESGLAEALLIGYKDDLDKSLVQSYSNTGVVHIIAISGMHLGLIYWLLVQVLKPLRRNKYTRLLQTAIIVSGLWIFSLLAGGQPSVLRSAVMFTCLIIAQNFARRTSIYNTLAFSAFALLCYDPYWLWDVGFQLSYSAVLSIVIFMRPVYNLFYLGNKVVDVVWKLIAVTLAAQILTTPISIYHFHQFPTYFLLTNLVAVPLSSVILLGEIFLCAISFLPSISILIGKALYWLIRIMNSHVEMVETFRYSLWEGLQIGILQAILLLVFTAGLSLWLIEKLKAGLKLALISLLLFFAARSLSFWSATEQEKIIVYNIPQHRAIDFVRGRNFFFYGDTALLADDFARNFHLRPSRVLNRISPLQLSGEILVRGNCILYKSKKILEIDTAISLSNARIKIDIDLLIVSKSPKIYIGKLASTFNIRQIVFDGSVPFWRLSNWKRDCDSLRIPYHDVSEKGAFVMRLN